MGRILKRRSQAETERFSPPIDTEVATNRALRIVIENIQAAARVIHQTNDPNAQPIMPHVTPVP